VNGWPTAGVFVASKGIIGKKNADDNAIMGLATVRTVAREATDE
jgi:hypothetical protein